MNTNLLNVVKEIIEKNGNAILSDPKRVSAFFADLARDEPKPQKNALIKCLEHGFAQTLKDVSAQDREACKQRLAQRLHDEEGLDLSLCGETLELLSAVLFGDEVKPKINLCKNCGKELQEGWKTCPYCSTAVGGQEISSAISSGSGGVGYGIWLISSMFSSMSQLDQNAQKLLESGQLSKNWGDTENAIRRFDEVIRLYPNFALAYCLRGDAYHSQSRYDMAIRDYTAAIRLNPNDALAYYERGYTYRMHGQYDLAINDLNEAIRLDPSSVLAYSQRGYVYSMQGQYDLAIRDFTEIIRLNPNEAYNYSQRGAVYANQKQYDFAIRDYTEAIRLEPDESLFYFERGEIFKMQGKLDLAIKDYTEVIRLEPDEFDKDVDGYVYSQRGEIYRMQGQYDLAISDLNDAIRIEPDNEFAYCVRGYTYRLKGQYNLAISDLNEAIRLYPNYAFAYGVRGQTYRQLGQKKQAIQDFEKALSLDANLGWISQELQETRGVSGFLKDLFLGGLILVF